MQVNWRGNFTYSQGSNYGAYSNINEDISLAIARCTIQNQKECYSNCRGCVQEKCWKQKQKPVKYNNSVKNQFKKKKKQKKKKKNSKILQQKN
jgi:hypothetical protein